MNTASRYRKKPVAIEAMRWTGDNIHAIWEWAGAEHVYWIEETRQLRILTLEGDIRSNEGDWIIKGVKGEIYPCKNDIFEATYESAEDA